LGVLTSVGRRAAAAASVAEWALVTADMAAAVVSGVDGMANLVPVAGVDGAAGAAGVAVVLDGEAGAVVAVLAEVRAARPSSKSVFTCSCNEPCAAGLICNKERHRVGMCLRVFVCFYGVPVFASRVLYARRHSHLA
jgi:hypothetical protein